MFCSMMIAMPHSVTPVDSVNGYCWVKLREWVAQRPLGPPPPGGTPRLEHSGGSSKAESTERRSRRQTSGGAQLPLLGRSVA